MKIRNFTAGIFAISLMFSGLSMVQNAQAVPASGGRLGQAIDKCLLAGDAKTRQTSSEFSCCSRSAGICVICPQPPSAGNTCEVEAYLSNPLPGSRAMSAGVLNGMRMKK